MVFLLLELIPYFSNELQGIAVRVRLAIEVRAASLQIRDRERTL
jgi:hypothetical protein